MEGTYAPQSPDLSAYHSSSPEPSTYPTQFQQYQKPYTQTSFDQSAYYQPPQQQQHQPTSSPYFPPPQATVPSSSSIPPSDSPLPPDDHDMSGSAGARSRQRRTKESNGSGSGSGIVPPDVEVKTKFPVARIKRIMQADEDVGKVAQVTPVAVSKALELFMIELVSKSAEEAKSKSSKRVTAAHLKRALAKDEQFDFLAEITSKIPDAPAPSDKTEHGEDSGDTKKRRPGPRNHGSIQT